MVHSGSATVAAIIRHTTLRSGGSPRPDRSPTTGTPVSATHSSLAVSPPGLTGRCGSPTLGTTRLENHHCQVGGHRPVVRPCWHESDDHGSGFCRAGVRKGQIRHWPIEFDAGVVVQRHGSWRRDLLVPGHGPSRRWSSWNSHHHCQGRHLRHRRQDLVPSDPVRPRLRC
jgi:hypothetical protein